MIEGEIGVAAHEIVDRTPSSLGRIGAGPRSLEMRNEGDEGHRHDLQPRPHPRVTPRLGVGRQLFQMSAKGAAIDAGLLLQLAGGRFLS